LKKDILKYIVNVKTLIFDFDGVILESATIREDALVHIFAGISINEKDRILAIHRDNFGVQRKERIRIIYKTLESEDPTTEIFDNLVAGFGDFCVNALQNCSVVPGIVNFLEVFKHLPLYIVSTAPGTEISGVIEQRGLAHFFKGIYGAPQKKAELICGILKEETLNPQQALFIGDRMSDFYSAKAVGVEFLGRVSESEKNPFPKDVNIISNFL